MIKKSFFFLLLFSQIQMSIGDCNHSWNHSCCCCHKSSHDHSKIKVKKHVLANGINIITCKNFKMPVIAVGMIYHTGMLDVPLSKNGIINFISENFISKNTHLELLKLGISYAVNVQGRYTEVLAYMHPKRLKAFFQIMSRNEFSVTNFEILKKQVILDHRLAHNCFADVVVNEILANIQYRNNPPVKMIFNESIFSSISEKDVMDYFETHYKKCHLSVIVSGAIHKKDAIEALRSAFGRQPPRETIPSEDVCSNDDEIMKEITIRNKHVGKSVQYFYKIPKNNIALSNSFFDILNYELFDFFEKINTMVSGYSCYNVISNGDCIKQIVFYPKFDVALADFQVAYNVFVDRVHKRKISSETFAKIMLLKKYSNQFSKQNLDETYSKIRSDYINNLNEENEITSPEQFSALSSDFLGSNLILKIITRYKSDK